MAEKQSPLPGSDGPDKRLERGNPLLSDLDWTVCLAGRRGGFLQDVIGIEREALFVVSAIRPEV